MNALIGLIILVVDVIAILDCVKSNKGTTKKIIWILVVLLLPVIGLVAYYLVGKKK